MSLIVPEPLAAEIRRFAEGSYPEEGAGFLLGTVVDDDRRIERLVPVENRWEVAARRRRYRIDPHRLVEAEALADDAGLTLLGVFHSHPDHPARPSEFDREWALPFFSYLITQVTAQGAGEMRAWRLSDDRRAFLEEPVRFAVPKETP